MKELRRLHALGKLPDAAEQFWARNKPVEELYDMKNDPHQLHNLAGSPQYERALQRLRAAHVKWMFQTKDLGFLPEPETNQRKKQYGSEYAILRHPDNQGLLTRRRAVACAAGQAGSTMPKLVAALKDPDGAVRYWAAIGLGNMGPEGTPAAELLTNALQDKSASVRVAAARALCLMEAEQKALPVLIRELASDRQWVRLNAALVLDSIGDKARPAVGALKQALKDKENKYVARVANHALNAMLGTNHKVKVR